MSLSCLRNSQRTFHIPTLTISLSLSLRVSFEVTAPRSITKREAMAVEDNGWQGISFSPVSNSGSGELSQRGDAISPEDTAWIDSCLVLDPESPDDSWGPLKDALLEVNSTPAPLYHNPSAADIGSGRISEGNDDHVPIPKEAETTLLWGHIGDNLLTNPTNMEENGFPEVEVGVGSTEDIKSAENISTISPEDTAWIASFLALGPDSPNDSWGPLKEALLEIIGAPAPSYYNLSAAEMGQKISEANDDHVPFPKEAEMTLLRGHIGDDLLINPINLEENGDPEMEVAAGSTEDIESPENIFRVWDLDTEFEEDEFTELLDKALADSSLRVPPPTLDTSMATELDEHDLDDLIAGISDLTLRPTAD